MREIIITIILGFVFTSCYSKTSSDKESMSISKNLDSVCIDKNYSLLIIDSASFTYFKLQSPVFKETSIIAFNNVFYFQTIKGNDIFIVQISVNYSTFGAMRDLIVWKDGDWWSFFINPIIKPSYKLELDNEIKDELSGITYKFEKGFLIPKSTPNL